MRLMVTLALLLLAGCSINFSVGRTYVPLTSTESCRNLVDQLRISRANVLAQQRDLASVEEGFMLLNLSQVYTEAIEGIVKKRPECLRP